MAKIIIQQSENGISVKSGSLLNKFYRVGELQATTGSVSGRVTITDTVEGSYVCFEQPYQDLVDNTDTAWGTTQANTVSNLNDVINATPQTYIKSTDKITDLDGVASADFTGKAGYAVIVGQADNSMSTSGKLLFTATDIKLGDDLNVQNHSIYTSTTNGDVQITPNGTGSVNLDGTVKFKRFDPSSAPDAFVGGMYADTNDDLYFGVDES